MLDLYLGDIQEDFEDFDTFLVDLVNDYQHDGCKEYHEHYSAYKHNDLDVHVPAYLSRNALLPRVGIGDHYFLDLLAVLDEVLDGGRSNGIVSLDEVALVLGLTDAAVDADRVVDK